MKKAVLVFYILSMFFDGYGQKVKKIRNETLLTVEIMEVLKTDKKVKNGNYLKKVRHLGHIIAKGNYLNNEKAGVWEYYKFGSNEIEVKYDYDNRILLESAIEAVNPAKIFYNGNWIEVQVDTMPVPIEGLSGLYAQLVETIKMETAYGEFPNPGGTVFSFVVSNAGEAKDYRLVASAGNKFDDRLLEVIKEYNLHWMPGRYEGENVDVEFVIPMHIIYTENTMSVKSYKILFQTIVF